MKEYIAQRNVRKEVWRLEVLGFTLSSSLIQICLLRPCCLIGSWRNPMRVMTSPSCAGSRKHFFQPPVEFWAALLWLHTGKHSYPLLEPEFVCDTRLRASVFLPVSFPLSLGRHATAVTVWLDLWGCGGAWLWCVYFVGIHISFWWLVTLPRCL